MSINCKKMYKKQSYDANFLLSVVSSPLLKIIHSCDNAVHKCTFVGNSLLNMLLLQVNRRIDNFKAQLPENAIHGRQKRVQSSEKIKKANK